MSDENQTETDTSTDNTDEPSKAELHDRVQQLESTVAKMMPSRRDALKLGAAGLAGAAGLSATSGSAEASVGSAGAIGSNSDRPDVFADEIDANSLTGSVQNQGCRVFLSSDQSVSQSVRTKIKFDSEVYDSGNNFDLSSHAWTCPKDGLYAINLQVAFDAGNSNRDRQVAIGTPSNMFPSNQGGFFKISSDPGDKLSASTINKYTQGSEIAAYAKNDSSSDTLQSGSANLRSFLEVAFLGGL